MPATELEELEPELADLIAYSWRIMSENGEPLPPLHEMIESLSLTASANTDFSNTCHDAANGQFCETHNGVHLIGFDDGTWPPKRVEAMAARARNLVKEYGIPITLDARPSDPGNHDNLAHINGVMAGVGINDPGTIHINPKLIDTEYLREQFAAGTTRAKSVSDIITHEYGHVLEDTLAERKEWDTLHEVRNQFTEAIGDEAPVQFDRNRLRMEVSYYAGQNDHEAVAESFLAYKQGHHNDWTTKVGQAFDRYFKKEANP